MAAWHFGHGNWLSRPISVHVVPPSRLVAVPRQPCQPPSMRVFTMITPLARSMTWHSLPPAWMAALMLHDRPQSSLNIMWLLQSLAASRRTSWSTWWSQGISRRPACGPRASWMPTPGPVATQFQSGFVTLVVMSRGGAQVRPSSALDATRTDLLLRQKVSQMVPVRASATGQGLPIATAAVPPSSWITCCGDQVRPPSVLRFMRRSMSPWSVVLVLRPSQKASTLPRGVTSRAGIR